MLSPNIQSAWIGLNRLIEQYQRLGFNYDTYDTAYIIASSNAWGAECAINNEQWAVETAWNKYTEIPF